MGAFAIAEENEVKVGLAVCVEIETELPAVEDIQMCWACLARWNYYFLIIKSSFAKKIS